MNEHTRAEIDDDPVRRRIARILDAKRRDNEEVLGALKSVDSAWDRLNKDVDQEIGREFDLLGAEERAVKSAREHLDRPEARPIDHGFVLGGRITDAEKRAGLSRVGVRVVREREGVEEVLAETMTDEAGNFQGLVPKEHLTEEGEETLRIEAVVEGGAEPVAVERRRVRMEAGRAEEVEVALPRRREVADRVAAADSLRDSIDESLRSVESRKASMRSAHTAVVRFAELTREGLETLREELAAELPAIRASIPVAGIEPPEPEGGEGGGGADGEGGPPDEPRAPDTSTPLEHVRGIGPKRAKRLRDTGVPDIEAFLATDMAALVEILGFDVGPTREEAERVLAEHSAREKRSSGGGGRGGHDS